MPFITSVNDQYQKLELKPKKNNKLLRPHTMVCLAVFVVGTSSVYADTAQNWYFDQDALVGYAVGAQVNKYNETIGQADQNLEEGIANIDLNLNETLISQSHEIEFIKDAAGVIQPCIDRNLLNQLQIRSDKLKPISEDQQCHLFLDLFTESGANWQFNGQTLTLNLIIPQSFLIKNPRGFIHEKEWDSGITALWIQHTSDYSHVKNEASEYDYFWSTINAGINFGPWQLRNQSHMRYLKSDHQKDDFDWQNTRTWLSRKFSSLNSELILGNAYTDADVFDSVNFTGLKLSTDRQMWPVGKLGYAPVVRGVAKTASQVIIKQNNQIIYEISVPPGPFIIHDLPDTNHRGDVSVDVVGNDGSLDQFLVPYSHLPSSMRPGSYTYSASIGEVRDFSKTNAKFVEATLQAGVSNTLTMNSGIRIADDYLAILLGNVWGTPWGAFELNGTWSMAKIADQSRLQGWRAEASYSKVFPSGTNLMLAAYRFSTQNFRDLPDILGQREALLDDSTYTSYTLQQRNRLTLSLNQDLGRFGNVSLTASTADYYDNQSRQSQLQFNYAKVWKGISFNIGATRQLSKLENRYTQLEHYILDSYSTIDSTNETSYFASVTFPLDWRHSNSNIITSMTHGKNNTNTNIGISGVAGHDRPLSWSINTSQNQYKDENSSSRTHYFTGTLQQNTPVGSWRLMYSQDNEHNQQYGAGLNGSLLIHQGGITLGPWSSGTLALIEAKGAQGATVHNGQGAAINRSGYALLANLTPYRYNYVSLNTGKMTLDTELTHTSKRVVPYAGAFVKVKFDTVQGHATLISGQLENHESLPMGAHVTGESGETLGMVGQGGQFYVRLQQPQGKIKVELPDNQYCSISYNIPKNKGKTVLNQIDAICLVEN